MSDADAIAAVSACEERRYAAIQKPDFQALDELFADDLIYIHGSAAIDTKASYIDSIKQGRAKYVGAKQSEQKFVAQPGFVLAMSRVNLDVQRPDGQVLHLDMRTLAVWKPVGKGWKLASVQSTRIP